MKYLRLILLPFSLIYACVIWLRNRFYDWGWFKQTAFPLPIIVVGNLAVGGTGKTPMTEHIIRLLSSKYKLATLSRGYGRKTKGFKRVETSSSAENVGDEPLQFKLKYSTVTVAVNENRVDGIKQLQADHEVVLLDDAFQHRALKPGLSIVLMEYASLLAPQYLLPAGNLRDMFMEKRRADIIVVTKCPSDIAPQTHKKILNKLNLQSNQHVFFTEIQYAEPQPLAKLCGSLEGNAKKEKTFKWNSVDQVLLVTGIANPEPLRNYISSYTTEIEHLAFPDHHAFTPQDLQTIRLKFEDLTSAKKIILTTEKDAMRLKDEKFEGLTQDLPIYYLPISLGFLFDEQAHFDALIVDYCQSEKK